MAAIGSATITPDRVMELQLRPGMLGVFRESLQEGGPLIKCYKGSLTLVSPGETHETSGRRLALLITAICEVFKIPHCPLGSTYFELPEGCQDSGYEPDESYYVQSFETASEGQVPDLAVEVVVTNSERKALANGVVLGIPELWVLNVPRHRLVFYHLAPRGKKKGTYQPHPRSLAFPFLHAEEVLERLGDPARDATVFVKNCRAWARRTLLPRVRARREGGD